MRQINDKGREVRDPRAEKRRDLRRTDAKVWPLWLMLKKTKRRREGEGSKRKAAEQAMARMMEDE